MAEERVRQVVALVALAATLFMASPSDGAPAMWVIRRGDCTVYLLGTVHATKWPTPPWFTGRLAHAFSASQELWLETTEDDARADGPGLAIAHPSGQDSAPSPTAPRPNQVMSGHGAGYYGLAEGAHDTSASSAAILSAAEKVRLATVAASLGLRPNLIEASTPSGALMMLGMVQLLRAGYRPEFGVDAVLAEKAKVRGEPVKGLETNASQGELLRWLSSDPSTYALKRLRRYLAEFPKQLWEADRDVSEWYAGDLTRTARENLTDARTEPEHYALLIASRNLGFARQIESRLRNPGVVFVAVGAAHFAGPDSVIALLRREGIAVQRY